jgi:hypothetical protein
MFSTSQLTDEQKQKLHQWAEEGASIADLQKQLKEEFGLTITYMDARFLVLDLDLKIREEESAESSPVPQEVVVDADPGSADETAAGAPGNVRVTMDEVAVPGAMVSGKVTFSDGEKAVWMIDQYGRPGLDPDQPGYRPSPEDIESFQSQLSELVRKAGI